MGLLRAGDPNGDVATVWQAKEAVRALYAHARSELALQWVTQLGRDLQDKDYPIEARSLGRTLSPLETPDRRVAHRPRKQRPDRGRQQPHQAGEAGRLRLHLFRNYRIRAAALRGQAQLGPTRHDGSGGHPENCRTPLKSEEPVIRAHLASQGAGWSPPGPGGDRSGPGADLAIGLPVTTFWAIRCSFWISREARRRFSRSG